MNFSSGTFASQILLEKCRLDILSAACRLKLLTIEVLYVLPYLCLSCLVYRKNSSAFVYKWNSMYEAVMIAMVNVFVPMCSYLDFKFKATNKRGMMEEREALGKWHWTDEAPYASVWKKSNHYLFVDGECLIYLSYVEVCQLFP